MEIEVELSKIIINESVDQQVIVLAERSGERSFPIVIGMPEILAIDRRHKGLLLPRPLTHDLLASVIHQLGGRLVRVVIHDLAQHTFFAKLMVQVGSRTVEIDSRPSDAIALAVGLKTPIYVDEQVFDKIQEEG